MNLWYFGQLTVSLQYAQSQTVNGHGKTEGLEDVGTSDRTKEKCRVTHLGLCLCPSLRQLGIF
jgi:hypothetical protein